MLCKASTKEIYSKKRNAKGLSSKILTPEYLQEHYIVKEKSIGEISKEVGYSRNYVMKLLKQYNIDARSKKDARKITLQRNKIIT